MAEYMLERDTSWERLGIDPASIDANVRLVASLIDARDYRQLFRRTGLRVAEDGTFDEPSLPLFLTLAPGKGDEVLANLTTAIAGLGLKLTVAALTYRMFEQNPGMQVATARFGWPQRAVMNVKENLTDFRTAIAKVIGQKELNRVSVPYPMQPCLEQSLADLDMPVGRKLNGKRLNGAGVVVGIIDDGCALAHRNFLIPGSNQSRVLRLWDQEKSSDPTGSGWRQPHGRNNSLLHGMDLDKQAIDVALANCARANGLIDEDRVYESLGYDVAVDSHGTHVMDIAAGNGVSLMASEGVAPAADIIFVQLPRGLIEEGGPVLESHILEGVQYIIDRAEDLKRPVVVNISYGGYSGPHDGTSEIANGIDELLEGRMDCAVVVAAGNGFEADCHASQTVLPGAHARPLAWNLGPEDPTSNLVEIWYEAESALELTLTPAGTRVPLPPVRLNESYVLKRASDQKIVGWISNLPTTRGNRPNLISIRLNATVGEDGDGLATDSSLLRPLPALTAPAPSGTWIIDLRNRGDATSTLDAWIARDDLRRGANRRRQQSRFASEDADPRSTIADLATGRFTISVGAHNTATDETCRYSASGPTRDGRAKPDLTAPAEELATGAGIMCASSRSAQPSRFNGTSASAPHVTGLVALLMQYNRAMKRQPMSVGAIREAICDGAQRATKLPPPPARALEPNRHQGVDSHRPPGKRQADIFAGVIGSGKANVPESLQ